MTAQKTSPRGGRRPDLAADLALTISACERHVGPAARPSLADVVATVCDRLESTARTTSGGPNVPDLRDVLSRALPGTTLQAVGDPPPVADQIARGIRLGIDAERLYSAVLGLEACRHIPLVWHQANKLVRSFPEYTAEDLLGWGWQGLRIALRAYDPTRFAFSTYACTRISGSIRDGVRAENPVPKRLATDVRKLQRAEEALALELSRTPTMAETVAAAGFTVEHAALLARCKPTASIEELVDLFDSERTPAWLGVDDEQPEHAAAAELRAAIMSAMENLPSEDADAVRMLILEEMPLAAAAAEAGVSPVKLRRRRDRALKQLAGLLSGWNPAAA